MPTPQRVDVEPDDIHQGTFAPDPEFLEEAAVALQSIMETLEPFPALVGVAVLETAIEHQLCHVMAECGVAAARATARRLKRSAEAFLGLELDPAEEDGWT